MKSMVIGAVLAAGSALAYPRNGSPVGVRLRVREDQRQRERQGHRRDLLGW
jgi:hypothetical protein